MWWSSRSHASEMSYRSSPDGLGPQSELVVLPRPPNVLDAPRRARVSSERADRAASRPSLTPNGICRAATTHLALDGLPSFQRRGSPDSWRVARGAWTTRRAAGGGQRCPAAQTSSDRLRCDHSSTACVTCVPAGPRRSAVPAPVGVRAAAEAPRKGGAVLTARRIHADRPACICRGFSLS